MHDEALKLLTPGEILLEEYLVPLTLSQNALGRAIGVSPRAINEIVLGKRSITPEMSIRLGNDGTREVGPHES